LHISSYLNCPVISKAVGLCPRTCLTKDNYISIRTPRDSTDVITNINIISQLLCKRHTRVSLTYFSSLPSPTTSSSHRASQVHTGQLVGITFIDCRFITCSTETSCPEDQWFRKAGSNVPVGTYAYPLRLMVYPRTRMASLSVEPGNPSHVSLHFSEHSTL
jgi:hypothetical protein